MTAGGHARRLFIALWPPDTLRAELEQATHQAVRRSGGSRIPPENLHVTLAFLGSVAADRIPDVFASIDATRIHAVELILGRLVWWERQELLCLEPTEISDALADAVARLQTELRARGFPIESRKFRAHLTLARDVRRAHELKPIKEIRWRIDSVELIDSRTLPGGSVYSMLTRPGTLNEKT